MANRLPTPGSDNGQWGQILNDFLTVEHNTDGTLKKAADITAAQATANDALPKAQFNAPLTDRSVPHWNQPNTRLDWASPEVINVKHFGAVGNGTTDDSVAVSAAFAELNSAGGGRLYFPRGNYLVSGNYSVNVPAIICGEGYGTIGAANGTSVLRLKNNANTDMIIVAAKNVTIQDLGLYGNKANQTTTSRGIVLSASVAANYFRFTRLWVDSFRDDGVVLQGPGTSLEGILTGCRIDSCIGYGISVVSGAADCQATDVILCQNTAGGASINAGSFVFSSCHIWGNTGSGIVQPSGAAGAIRVMGSYIETNGGNGIQPRGTDNQITGCRIWRNNGRGIYAFSNTGLVISNNTVIANNVNAASGATGAGVNLDTCVASLVSSNYFAGQGQPQRYGYAETGNTCNQCLFVGNVSRATDHSTGSWLVGTGNPTATVVANNVG
jgi:Pectate lyase superfamily protein/Right handed beta helix region